MDENGSPTTTPAPDAAATPTYESTNDLGFEMTPEQEQDFVNKTLGFTDPSVEAPKDDNKADAPKPDGGGEDPKAPEVPATEPEAPKAPEQPAPAPVKPPEVPEREAKPTEPASVDTSDLWIEVENADGEAIKITLDGGLPDDFQFKTDKQLYEVMDSMREMKELQAEREAELEANLEKQTAQQSQESQLASWENETQTLIDAGLIPEPKLKAPADGKQFTPEEVENDPSLKLQNDVYTFMKTENDKRLAEGKQPLLSFGTMLNIYQQQQKASEEAKAKEEEVKLTKERGALIGGDSAASGGEKSTYVAGSHSNIWNVPVDA